MIAGIMGRKEQLLEAIFGSMRSSKEVTATSRRHQVKTSGQQIAEVNNFTTSPRRHVATSPRRHVATSPRRDVTTSRRQLENLHLIIKCQRAQNLGDWRTCGGRHENREQSNTAFKELLGILYHFSIVLDIFGSHDDVFHIIHFVSFLHDVLNLFLGLHQTLSQTMD